MFTILDYSSALEYSIIRRYTNIVYYIILYNKQRFIALLSQRLEQVGCEIHQSRGDADVLIVQTALTSSAKLSKKPFWLGTIQICVCSSSIMKITSGITSSDLKLDGRVRRQKKMLEYPFLEVLSLTTL